MLLVLRDHEMQLDNKKKSPEVEELRRMIPYQISFDGCAYVLLDANGDPLYKPWRFRPMRRSCSSP